MSAHLRWSFVCRWDNNGTLHVSQRCLQVKLMKVLRMMLLFGSCDNNPKLDLQISSSTTRHYLQLRMQQPWTVLPFTCRWNWLIFNATLIWKQVYWSCDSSVYEQYVPANQYPELIHHARTIIALFGITYLCEQLFSKVIFAKSKTGAHLENTLRLASTYLQPDIQGLVK